MDNNIILFRFITKYYISGIVAGAAIFLAAKKT